ncbi:methyltransferase domain-containing protein [uncultured Sphaerochaeta sp.]|uniref:SAM-dependent methyltransferase n=1 Tax=uncultured Sphaerochaeta sp. TaxID=886478 RepID=UPI002A0A9605|nr:methyltransferase domain-containing protein [uncultured Sphaerochaeta sp.]
MKTPLTDTYDKNFLLETMMGPNAMRITEELASSLPIAPGMRILDLGCGMGISSILLAEKYDVTVFAADLWISPTDNAKRFAERGLDAKIFPFLVDATKEIPFAHDYFDMIISVDSYQYFGTNESMLANLLPFVKKNGYIAVVVPGFNKDFPDGKLPKEVQPFWTPEWYFYSLSWWKSLWEKEPGIEITEFREMTSCKQAWDDWLQSPNPYAKEDLVMMEAGVGKYFNIIQMVGRKR